MARFEELSVAQIDVLTKDAKSVYFEIPDHLVSDFQFIPGQYLTFEIMINGIAQRRAYSICTSPYTDENIAIGVKKIPNGLVSSYMNETVQVGDVLKVLHPMGNFIHKPSVSNENNYILLGGGSGITPLMSILKSILAVENKSKVGLLYINRNIDSVMFYDVLEALKLKYPQRLQVVHHWDEDEKELAVSRGKMSTLKINTLLEQYWGAVLPQSLFYVCGPSGLMQLIDSSLNTLSISKSNIFKEHFTPVSDAKETKNSATSLDKATLQLLLDGENIEVPYTGQNSILEAVIDAGYDPPFACQIGACCTCRAKLSSGKVVMADREALSDAEIADGYILTCQSKPLTEKLVYSYDE